MHSGHSIGICMCRRYSSHMHHSPLILKTKVYFGYHRFRCHPSSSGSSELGERFRSVVESSNAVDSLSGVRWGAQDVVVDSLSGVFWGAQDVAVGGVRTAYLFLPCVHRSIHYLGSEFLHCLIYKTDDIQAHRKTAVGSFRCSNLDATCCRASIT